MYHLPSGELVFLGFPVFALLLGRTAVSWPERDLLLLRTYADQGALTAIGLTRLVETTLLFFIPLCHSPVDGELR